MKIITVVGARPQFVKASVLSRKITEKYKNDIDEIIVHTGQHYDDGMSEIFFSELGIKSPKYNLGVGSKSHGKQTGEMLAKIDEILLAEKPDYTVVYGDTNSTLAGALSACKLNIDVIHIESGYRNYNLSAPEEPNRLLTDHISKILCCCSQNCVENLIKEGIYDGKIMDNERRISVVNTGDIMYEAFLYNKSISSEKSTILERLNLSKYVLVTVHRPDNTSKEKFIKILEGLNRIPEKIVFPVHPRTKKLIEEHGLSLSGNITLIEPVGYLDMISLISGAMAVITDSGGVLREACFMKVPCITLRDRIEAIETLMFGYNVLLKEEEFVNMGSYIYREIENRNYQPFGDGNASEHIIGLMTKGAQ